MPSLDAASVNLERKRPVNNEQRKRPNPLAALWEESTAVLKENCLVWVVLGVCLLLGGGLLLYVWIDLS